MSNDQSDVAVQLLVFSGRPDPTFGLEQSEIESLSNCVQQTVGQEQVEEASEGGLGYHGFRVTNNANVQGLPAECEVYQGTLTVTPEGQSWRDTAGCESLLLTAARNRGFGELLDAGGPQIVA